MPHKEFSQAKNHWKHWVIYSTATFLSIFVFAEFALSVSFLSILAPSTFMFYFTPVGFFVGEALVSFFASVLVFLGLFVVLRQKVYVKTDRSLKFNQSESYLLLPFYLIPLASLGIYISLIPLELSNLLTYAVFLILFESFIEHVQVSDYSVKVKLGLKVPEPFKKVTSSRSESTADSEEIQKTLEELERITEIHEKEQIEKKSSKKEIGKRTSEEELSSEEVEEVVSDLREVLGLDEEEEVEREEPSEEEISDEEEKRPTKDEELEELLKLPAVGKKRAKKLYESGLESPQDIVEKGLEGLADVENIGIKTAKKILKNAKELEGEKSKEKEREENGGIEAEVEELEDLILDE